MRWVWSVIAVAACNGGNNGDDNSALTCGAGTVLVGTMCLPASNQTCGSGTHEQNGVCLPDPRFEIRALPAIRADGYTASEVRVVGTNNDGTPSLENVVVSVNRASAGAFVSPAFVLGDRGGATNFRPCNAAVPGCTGPARLDLALASAPQTPVASVDIDLVAPPPIASLTPCMGTSNIFYLDSQNFGTTGTVSITNNTFDVFGYTWRSVVHVVDNNIGYSLEMNTQQLGIPLLPSVYENAKGIGTSQPGEATFSFTGPPSVNCNVISSFQVHEFTYDASLQDVTLITATFEQHCESDATRRRTGCVHYSQ